MTIRFPRMLRATAADMRSYTPAAEPLEWAVTGAFRFAHRDPASLMGRERQAFKSSWVGLASFRPGTLVEIAEISTDELDRLARLLAAHLLEAWQAPDAGAAVDAARAEIEFALTLSQHPRATVLALEREFNDQGMIERTRIVTAA